MAPKNAKKDKSSKPEPPTSHFFHLKYGTDQRKIFNADTTTILLLDKIRELCTKDIINENGSENTLQNVDIATMEGSCVMLHEEATENAKAKIEPRGEYLLVSYEVDGENNKTFTCLWTPPEPAEGEEPLKIPNIVAGGAAAGKKKGKK
eukprot:CAMPEP_0117450800 /NCGR_PEP_ID=MMETSP0759-20121206/8662_1 /TAXON_ID=63605 /ORGANISM="Percolomonas cosmopolitus, Strain WS" /LENGTH=148 /DNA_ID=CAMNT_0005243347 /DNA_START=24 /DNA_END=470 /DNA_ORIENTATION=+